jgi:NNP family nitrate/nitrite transporter-like MFS transporter
VLATGATAGAIRLENAGLLWIPLILLACVAAWLFMDNLTVATAGLTDQLVVARRSQTWVMSFIYIGTFGSFIGFSAAFPLLIKVQFPAAAIGGLVGVKLAFVGALIGSLSRPVGGWLADRLGGAKVTLWVFAGTAAGTVTVLAALKLQSFGLFFAGFVGLFSLTGLGNGSTYRMIPAIWRTQALAGIDPSDTVAVTAASRTARTQGAAVLGFVGAIGALGGAFFPVAFTIAGVPGVSAAFYGFLAFYTVCAAVTWWFYLRTSFAATRLPSLAHAGV